MKHLIVGRLGAGAIVGVEGRSLGARICILIRRQLMLIDILRDEGGEKTKWRKRVRFGLISCVNNIVYNKTLETVPIVPCLD